MRGLYSDSTFLTFFSNFLFLQITLRGRDKRVPSRPIFALPSSTFPLKQGFRAGRLQKVRRGNADVPHENAIFRTKCWKVVQNLVPEIPLYAALLSSLRLVGVSLKMSFVQKTIRGGDKRVPSRPTSCKGSLCIRHLYIASRSRLRASILSGPASQVGCPVEAVERS